MSKLDELYNKKKDLVAQVADADAELFAELKLNIEKVDTEIAAEKENQDLENERKKAREDAEARAARKPSNADLFDQKRALQEDATKCEIEKRAKTLRDGGKIVLEKRAVQSSSTAMSKVASDTINPAFEQVGSLDKLVNTTDLEGGESYKKPFVKSYAEGGITEEGKAATTAEPTFEYAEINKIKITAYAEVTEEVEKLPDAKYVPEVEKAVLGAYRKKLIDQIVNGTGTGEMVGILNAPAKIIEASRKVKIATIDENTLDNIVFKYGGDEDVEDDAVLLLNKLTLKEFAKVKGTDKKRAYDIVIHGNTGTINGTGFVITSKLPSFENVSAGNVYMAYGKLKGYELTNFSDLEIEKSKDYKFKEGMVAYKVSRLVGGSPAMWNGFDTYYKAEKTTQTA